MNLLLLAIAFRVWSGSALSAFLRIMAAIAALSVEMQLATWSQSGTLNSIRIVNVVVASLAVLWRAKRPPLASSTVGPAHTGRVPRAPSGVVHRWPPLVALLALFTVVATLTVMRPVMGADPYHLHRVDQVTGRGTLAYDPAALDIKVNALAGVYELLLADLRIPGMSTALVRLHGLFGLGLYLLSVAAVVPWVQIRRRWLLLVFLVIPVVFHQFVLVKNDLFGALPAFVALAWVVTRGRAMSLWEIGAAAALAGFSVGIKISSAPIALIVTAFVLFDHRAWRSAGAAAAGGVAGAVAGGLMFTLVANHAVYGGALQPYLALGNRHETAADALLGLWRFSISLVDLGFVTPRVWPGRGGWGSTFGLAMVWALVALGLNLREPMVRRALAAAAGSFVVFGLSYPDADIAHRMVIAPGLLLVLVALSTVDGTGARPAWLRRALVAVMVLSTLQIGRSAFLYLQG